MAAKLELSIRAAVTSGFERCSDSEAPLCCLGEFLDQLRELGWGSADVGAVESSILELLGKAKEDALEQHGFDSA
jgi:hypothetical protein